jgi:hypothetical protein
MSSTKAVGDRLGDPIRRKLDQGPAPQAGPGVGRELWLDPDHTHPGATQFDGRRDPTDQPAAAYGHEHRLHVRQVLQDLRPDGPLSGHKDLVVVRRHGDVAVLCRELLGPAGSLGAIRTNEDDLSAQGDRRV